MSKVTTYFRPADLPTALRVLGRADIAAAPLAGGTWLVPRLRADVDLPDSLAEEIDAVVDLADLGLGALRLEGMAGSGWLHLGATALLADLADDAGCQAVASGLLASAARREGPANLRNAATIAGTVLAAEPGSELVLALLALDARANIAADGSAERLLPLADLLADPRAALGKGLITELRLPWPAEAVRGGMARVARTPADRPIVAAAAVVESQRARVAVGGVTPLPVVVQITQTDDPESTLAKALRGHAVLSDFRGSAEYRLAMAPIIARRALNQAG